GTPTERLAETGTWRRRGGLRAWCLASEGRRTQALAAPSRQVPVSVTSDGGRSLARRGGE
ncbi:MAG: hypothetical protein FWD90_14285, partial [Defluviitaleaceae bacterium]|nr:hypothetical protein [Defluviitaleaceae bacterium]